MKHSQRRLLIVLLMMALVSAPVYSRVEAADTENYDNYVAVTVHPDGSITVTLKGGHSDSSPFTERPAQRVAGPFEMMGLNLNVTAVEEGLTNIENRLRIKLDPSDYASMANLNLDIKGYSGETSTNLTAHIDYPGYLGVDGSLGFVVVEPPSGFVLDLGLDAKLYYANFPREELSMVTAMVPLLETQLSAMVMNATDGNIVLERLELLGYEEATDYASINVRLSLSGDLRKGLQHALESVYADLEPEEAPQEAYPLSIESYDYHVTFIGDTLTLEADSGGTLAGDLDARLNDAMDDYLGHLLEGDELDQRDRALVAQALPLVLHVENLHMEVTTRFEEDRYTSTFTVENLGLEPPSFKELLALLEGLSRRESLGEFKLVLEGATSGNRYVAFTVPDGVEAPLVEEEGRLVWDMDEIENLEDVTYEVKTRGLDTMTIVAASAIGVAAIGAAAFYLMRRRA